MGCSRRESTEAAVHPVDEHGVIAVAGDVVEEPIELKCREAIMVLVFALDDGR